jgi:hypothetical protein
MRLKRVDAVVVLLALAGCRVSEVSFVDTQAIDFDYFAIVAVDANGRAVRTSRVFGVENGKIAFGGHPLFAFDEAGAYVVGFDREALFQIHPGFELERAKELELHVGTPPAAPLVRSSATTAFADAALPDRLSVRAAGAAMPPANLADMLRSTLVLAIPIDPESCRAPGEGRLEAFGDHGDLLPLSRMLPVPADNIDAAEALRNFWRIVPLDADRVLAISFAAVYLIHRGQPIAVPDSLDRDIPAGMLPAGLLHRTAHIEAIAVDLARPGANGTLTAYVGGEVSNDGLEEAAIFELEISSAGVRYARTASITGGAGLGKNVLDLMIDHEGTVIAVGTHELLLVKTATSSVFRAAAPIPDLRDVRLRRAITTQDQMRPHLIADDIGRFHAGDALAGTWTSVRRDDRLSDERIYGLAETPDGREQWAVGVKGSILRRIAPDFAWQVVRPVLPPRLAPCANADAEGQLAEISGVLRSVAVDDQAAYIAVSHCRAVLRVRRSDLCAAAIPFEDRPIENTPDDFFSAAIAGDELLIGGSFGALWRTRLAD